ncbi:MAG TPA: class I SAM-dependent methyltransferase [Vicinamibacterales bacterium]|jgi:ubiquinone/menaquinone biosynthesis C-methylase UbiE|nr:class I SAM-dependent methyltransferase [Vicinamibacterales bacterium]
MALFSFRRLDIDPLAVSMAGVKLGERLLQIGVDDAGLAGQLAAKTGLSGTAAHMVSTDDEAVLVNRGAKKAGVLVEVRVGPLDRLPFDESAFDLVVIHSTRGQLASAGGDERTAVLEACRRLLRPGGRIMAIEAGTTTGLRSMLRSAPAAQAAYDASGGTVAALQQAGFGAVRDLGDREGLKFAEGVRTT